MPLTVGQQDCRNVAIYFEVLLKKMMRGYILDEHDFRDYKSQLEKFKQCFIEGEDGHRCEKPNSQE